MDEKVTHILSLHNTANTELERWKPHYEELAKYFLPMKDNVYGADVTGERKHNFLFDSTSLHANELFAAMLHTLLSSPNQEFFDMTTGDPAVDRDDAVRAWRQLTVRTLHSILSGTNYHSQAHEAFLDIGGFGMLVMRQEECNDDVVRYSAEPCYNYSFIENKNGVIDTIFREFEFTYAQLIEKFGLEVLPLDMQSVATKKPLDKVKILHAVLPRDRYLTDKKNRTNKKYASYYILLKNKLLLSEGGYDIFPYIITRFHVISGETRGRGPSMKALPDARVLNAMQKTALKVAQKLADPVYLLPDDGVMRPFKTAPGSINYYRGNLKDAITTLDNNARPDFIEQMSENIRERIKKAFHVDQMLLREGPQMTATEVMQRAEEQLRMLGPVQGRFENEYLRPLIEGLFYWAQKRKKIEPAPEMLAGKPLRIRFKSTMARSQNMLEVDNLNRMIGTLAPFIQIFPEITDLLAPEEILKYISELYSTPQSIIRDGSEVQEIRQESAEYAQQMTDQQLQMQQAQTTKLEADAVSKLI